jgi:hypothetical protein
VFMCGREFFSPNSWFMSMCKFDASLDVLNPN